MEVELNVPIVASNPAMLWFVLSKLGLSYRIAGYGKLLASWPALPPMVSQHIKEARVEKS